MSAVTVSNEREVNPMQLSLEQLNALKQQHEEEIQELSAQLEQLHGAKARFVNALAAIDEVSKSKNGDSLLVPLNSSLYVPGKIVEPEKVIVELGTGYFCEKTAPAAKDLLNRKVIILFCCRIIALAFKSLF